MNPARASPARAAVFVLAIGVAGGPAAGAATPVAAIAVRAGDHADFGRIVIDTNSKTGYTLEQDGDHVVVHLQNDVPLGAPPPPPRNVIGIKTDGSTLDLMVRP